MDRGDDESRYRVHVNMNDGLDGCSYFLKAMVGDFAERLSIPAALSRKLRKETGEDIILQGPSARQWVVKLWGTNPQLEFRQGWEKFAVDHAIESGDFLVFKYVCRSYFKVRIFGKNGCEKKIIISSENSDKRCSENATATQLPTASDFEEELSDHTEAKVPQMKKKFKFSPLGWAAIGRHRHKPSLAARQKETVKSAEPKRKRCQVPKSCHLPRRCRNMVERNKAIQAAYSFTSSKPFCLVNMAASHVYKRFWLNLPKNAEERLKLPKEMRVVILMNSDSNEWRVRYSWSDYKDIGAFGAGWKLFSVENNLQKGDICIFERVDKSNNIIKLRVHIFRIAEESNNLEDGMNNDKLAIPTSHSNKKMKVSREDLGTNLNLEDGMSNDRLAIPTSHSNKKMKVSREDLSTNLNLEDGMNNDRLAKSTSHSNKKIKVSREDLSTNLPANLCRPEQGKPGAKHCRPEQGKPVAKHCHPEQRNQGAKHGAKQVEGKKKKTNTGSNHLKETESKYAPSLSDSKAGFRRSLRFAKRCDLVKPTKKEVLCLPSSLAEDTVVLSDETTPLDDVNGEEEITSVDDMNVEEEEDTTIVLDGNGEPHAMGPQSGALNPSQDSIPQGQFMRISSYPKMKSKGETSSLVVAL